MNILPCSISSPPGKPIKDIAGENHRSVHHGGCFEAIWACCSADGMDSRPTMVSVELFDEPSRKNSSGTALCFIFHNINGTMKEL